MLLRLEELWPEHARDILLELAACKLGVWQVCNGAVPLDKCPDSTLKGACLENIPFTLSSAKY